MGGFLLGIAAYLYAAGACHMYSTLTEIDCHLSRWKVAVITILWPIVVTIWVVVAAYTGTEDAIKRIKP